MSAQSKKSGVVRHNSAAIRLSVIANEQLWIGQALKSVLYFGQTSCDLFPYGRLLKLTKKKKAHQCQKLPVCHGLGAFLGCSPNVNQAENSQSAQQFTNRFSNLISVEQRKAYQSGQEQQSWQKITIPLHVGPFRGRGCLVDNHRTAKAGRHPYSPPSVPACRRGAALPGSRWRSFIPPPE